MPPNPNSLEKVNIFLSAANLASVQILSTTDPFAVVYLKDHKTHQLDKVGTTELINDNLNPKWATAIMVDYMFEVSQEVVVKLFHQEGKSHPISDESKHLLLGEHTFLLSTLMRSGAGGGITAQLTGGKHTGTVTIRGEAQANTRDLFCVTFSGVKLANKDGFFGTSDPFLEVSRCNEDSSYSVVWKSSKIDNTLSPKWAEVKIPMATLCNNDLDRPLKLQVFDWDSNGKHQSMGIASTSVRAMLAHGAGEMEVIEKDKQAKDKKYTNSGHINAANPRIEHYPTFSEFIQGGLEINLVVAIDFTGSNGDPRQADSLHHIDPSGKLNAYETAITAVGGVLEKYDTDKRYAVYGFGGRLPDGNGGFSSTQHCFPVYSGGAEVSGVDGILQAYRDALGTVMLSGPTLFAPLVGGGVHLASSNGCSQASQKYTILLVLTDGTFEDMDATLDAIIAGANTPLSIIMVGIGSADFSELNVLDGDKGLLKRGGKTATRDIVQFVPFTKVAGYGLPVVAQQVLAEVPNQVLKYFELHNIVPNKR